MTAFRRASQRDSMSLTGAPIEIQKNQELQVQDGKHSGRMGATSAQPKTQNRELSGSTFRLVNDASEWGVNNAKNMGWLQR